MIKDDGDNSNAQESFTLPPFEFFNLDSENKEGTGIFKPDLFRQLTMANKFSSEYLITNDKSALPKNLS